MIVSGFHLNFEYPVKTEPEWAPQVERWYQLDAAAYGVTELYYRNRKKLPLPGRIFLASPGASNHTDRQFAQGAPSPSKFVHTLPNIRSAPLLQVMKWSGRVFCIQKDPETITSALLEAANVGGVSWVVSAIIPPSGPAAAYIFVLGAGNLLGGRSLTMAKPGTSDKDWVSQI